MNKIGIITFHAANNSGSMLQAYALQSFLKTRYGVESEIIDYSNETQRRMYSIFCMPKNPKDLIRNLLYLPSYRKIAQSEKGYHEFKKNFVLSEKVLKAEDIKKFIHKYDCLIAGSDQVWNINAMDFDLTYMLPFKNIKKVAYAVSLGASNPNKEPNNVEYKNCIKDFSAISVRENNAKKWIEELVERDVELCVDPTLLIEKSEWLKVTDDWKVEEPYIFWYAMTYKKEQADLLQALSKKYNMPVYVMNAKEWVRRNLRRKGIKLAPVGGPGTFLSLVSNASMVITSSFHGSVFSYIYQKNFWYINIHKVKGNDDRAACLLNQLGLTERYIDKEEAMAKNLLVKPQYDEKYLKPYVVKSINFIEKEIVGKKETNEN